MDKIEELKNNPDIFWNDLADRVDLNMSSIEEMNEFNKNHLMLNVRVMYEKALQAEEQGNLIDSRNLYKRTFELLPNHIQSLDNYAIGLVEEHRFSEAIPYFEQSAAADRSSSLSFLYLLKCYKETDQKISAFGCAKFMLHHWPDKSPFIDWSHLDNKKVFKNKNLNT